MITRDKRIRAEMGIEEFTEVFLEHHNAIWRFLRFVSCGTHDVPDKVQETFISAWKHRTARKPETQDLHFLLRIANNIRRRKFWRISWTVKPCDPVILDQCAARGVQLPDALAAGELLERLRRELPIKQWVVLYLLYAEEFTEQEIADALKIPRPTVAGRLRLARQKVGKLMLRLERSGVGKIITVGKDG